ncbi:hypothetical protein RAS12_16900 [Achromobacter seleniivolatilans]|uniref:EamA domain-containing protein n=1 Tax=Achromobacter seleniivolatilans TaxID=3047478 RepID=A0ABY9LVW1_9BURK|nr:hypothetical protein [Achromobacter sp. R39]WMD18319.1 hypothetical protein RAS12_16900 [Achromobacter sp. R39]
MLEKGSVAFYLSAAAAIVGTVGYHMLMKKVPSAINPIVSLLGIYVAIIAISALFLPFVMGNGTLGESLRQMTGVQAGIAVCIILMEIGFLLMYRSGWDLSTGNVVTGAIVNIALIVVGVLILREDLSLLNMLGIALCVAGVFLIGYKSAEPDPVAASAIHGHAPPAQAALQIKNSRPSGE